MRIGVDDPLSAPAVALRVAVVATAGDAVSVSEAPRYEPEAPLCTTMSPPISRSPL